ncbi:MAG: hypothetical protein JJ873_16085 [Maricaulis sp.]|uniref:hypothetical protein n=1 Tax=Maricaulis sp. TaxID=1486257 RepID=UPI001B0B309A|nr:hypothetical protein [Maricaulis sp.]MBO6878902.1 hypothetical protein [Maricaulis sp.]
MAISEDGRQIAGVTASVAYHASQYRPLDAWVCAPGSQECQVARTRRRLVRVGANAEGGFWIESLGSARATLENGSAGEIEFSEFTNAAIPGNIILPSDTLNARANNHRPTMIAGIDGSRWIASVYPEPMVFPILDHGELGDGGWPIYAGPERVLVGVFGHSGVHWLEGAPISHDQDEWLAGIYDRHPGALIRAITLTADGRFAAYAVSGVSYGGAILVRDDQSSMTRETLCESEFETEVAAGYSVQIGTQDRPLWGLRFDASSSPAGLVVWFVGGPRSSAYNPTAVELAHPFLQRNLAVLVVDYSGSQSPIRDVDRRLARNAYMAVTEDWAAIDEYLRRSTQDCSRNILAATSYGGIYFQAMASRQESCVGSAFLAAPWLQYRDPMNIMESRAFGNRDRASALEWEETTFGSQIHDRASPFRQLQTINSENCKFGGPIYGLFAESDTISQPGDLGACLNLRSTRIFVRSRPYDMHDTILTQTNEILEEAATYLLGEPGPER